MTKYLISFDLNTSNENYEEDYIALEEEMGQMGFICKPLNNVFLLATQKDAIDIRRALLDCASSINALLVIQVNNTYASFNFKKKNEEIKEILEK